MSVMAQVKPNIVFHMAAQSSVLVSYQKPMKTVYENVIGTYKCIRGHKKMFKCEIRNNSNYR